MLPFCHWIAFKAMGLLKLANIKISADLDYN